MQLVILFSVLAAHAADVAKGEAVYQANCSACHGQAADGKGPAGPALNPGPSDFTAADWWQGKDDVSIKASIKNGSPGTAMMPFAHLADEDVANIIAFLRSKQPK